MNLLACLDLSPYATSVADHAAWVASACPGRVELLHVIQRRDAITRRGDLSGALGLGARSNLMEELVSLEESEARLAREQGQALLDTAAARLAVESGGGAVSLHQRAGVGGFGEARPGQDAARKAELGN